MVEDERGRGRCVGLSVVRVVNDRIGVWRTIYDFLVGVLGCV